MLLDVLEDSAWQMSPSERAALKGLLGDCRPATAIEIGMGSGGSLRRIAAVAGRVHALDLAEPPADLAALPNVTFHTGDSHELLPGLLAELAEAGTNADFVLVDGDHTGKGVRRDLEDLLASSAVEDTLIVLHDTANPEVRAGLDAIDYAARQKVSWVDLDWLPGFMFRDGPSRDEAWGGLAIVLVDARRGPAAENVVADYAYSTAELLASRATSQARPAP
jgi:predicted O-methyltransferase YrrM